MTTVKVTEEDITTGIKESNCDCPIAKALKRLALRPETVRVYAFDQLYIDGKRYSANRYINDFIVDFDKGHPVKPFEFVLGDKTWSFM